MVNSCKFERSSLSLQNKIYFCFFQTPFSKDARGVLDETIFEKKNFLRIRIFHINTYSSELAKKYNFQVIDLHYLVRKFVQHRCKDGMHYDALIHRLITTEIARYIACGFNQNLPEYTNDNDKQICLDILQTILDKIDHQITEFDRNILQTYRPTDMDFDLMVNLNEKEKNIFYLIDYYETKLAQNTC